MLREPVPEQTIIAWDLETVSDRLAAEARSISPDPALSPADVAAAKSEDDSIPDFLRRCVQCGAHGDVHGVVTEHEIGGVRLPLHPQCHSFLCARPEAARELIDRVRR